MDQVGPLNKELKPTVAKIIQFTNSEKLLQKLQRNFANLAPDKKERICTISSQDDVRIELTAASADNDNVDDDTKTSVTVVDIVVDTNWDWWIAWLPCCHNDDVQK